MRRRLVFSIAAVAAALTVPLAASTALAKKKKWALQFTVSDDPTPGHAYQTTAIPPIVRGKVDGQPVLFVSFYDQFASGDPGRPRLHFALPDIDYAGKSAPFDVVPLRTGWMHYPDSASDPLKWGDGAGSTVKVTVVKYDKKKRKLSADFAFTALADADPSDTVQPVDVNGSLLVALPASLAGKPSVTFTLGHSPTLEFTEPIGTVVSNGTILTVDIQPAEHPLSADVEPVHLFFDIPQVDFASQTFPLPLTAGRVTVESKRTSTTPDMPFGDWGKDPSSTVDLVITDFDKKKKLLAGTFSFVHLTAGPAPHSQATLDASGSFVLKVKLNKP